MNIIFEHKDFFVVDKPSGIPVHHGVKTERALTDELLQQYPEIAFVGEKDRPGIVHRLDQDVSGVLLVARTKEGYRFLRTLFDEHKVQKEYTVLVFGKVQKPEGEINFPLGRSKEDWRKIATKQDGKVSRTLFEVLKNYQQYTLLKVRTITGRTHQIRVHFYAYGHSIVGDPVYHIERYSRRKDISRIFLHASKISFGEYHFEAPLPHDLQIFLNRLY
mgnify:CR=1 FL=1